MWMLFVAAGTVANQTGTTECTFCESGRYQPSLGKIEWYSIFPWCTYSFDPLSMYVLFHFTSIVPAVSLFLTCFFNFYAYAEFAALNASRGNSVRLSGSIACSAKPVLVEIYMILSSCVFYMHMKLSYDWLISNVPSQERTLKTTKFVRCAHRVHLRPQLLLQPVVPCVQKGSALLVQSLYSARHTRNNVDFWLSLFYKTFPRI